MGFGGKEFEIVVLELPNTASQQNKIKNRETKQKAKSIGMKN